MQGQLLCTTVVGSYPQPDWLIDRQTLGRGMVPRPAVSGLGLGLPLMTTLSRQLAITDGDGGRGTAVRMVFALDDDPGRSV